MGIAVLALIAAACARPDGFSNEVHVESEETVLPSDSGEYTFRVRTSDGTEESQGGVRFVLPNGDVFQLQYVANAEGGYQPQSTHLPVAPVFPHEIPPHALAQIKKAAEERALLSSEETE